MIVVVNVSQPFLRAKPNHDGSVCCFVDGERVLGFLAWKYLALVDEVIPFRIFPCANDPCQCPCQVGQCVVVLVGIAGVMINLLKYLYLLGALLNYLFALLNWN
jgi:hypothetical protein